eukprot:765459-Hanusia_phi.AAC.3
MLPAALSCADAAGPDGRSLTPFTGSLAACMLAGVLTSPALSLSFVIGDDAMKPLPLIGREAAARSEA